MALTKPLYSLQHKSDLTTLVMHGDWLTGAHLPQSEEILQLLFDKAVPSRISINASELRSWDTGLLRVIIAVTQRCEEEGVHLDFTSVPEGVRSLLHMALQSRERSTDRGVVKRHWVENLGSWATSRWQLIEDVISFLGEMTLALIRLCGGQSRMRVGEFVTSLYRAGPEALPIVTLISLLVGVILSLIGAVQLQQFGAQIYIANLVGIGMTREMGAVMAGVILAGRTGAAFAAELGTMQGNEEIDAFITLGVPVTDFLVLPRMLALMCMMPLLCLYADLLGILGGAVASWISFSISPVLYMSQVAEAVRLSDLLLGVTKGFVFGILIALAGCYYGICAGRSSSAVGQAATSAVVSSIVLIVLADAFFSVIAQHLNL